MMIPTVKMLPVVTADKQYELAADVLAAHRLQGVPRV